MFIIMVISLSLKKNQAFFRDYSVFSFFSLETNMPVFNQKLTLYTLWFNKKEVMKWYTLKINSVGKFSDVILQEII